MTATDIRVCFVGDSFTVGTGDPDALGWVGRVTARALRRGHAVTAYNLGVRRQTSAEMLRRMASEVAPRRMVGTETRIVLSFGANDTALEDGVRRLSLGQTLSHARELVRQARAIGPTLWIGPPPVADAEHDARIAALSSALANVATEEGVPYLDVFTPLATAPAWRAEVSDHDGHHPRAAGYEELASLVDAWLAWWFRPDEPR